MTVIADQPLSALAGWIEQIMAESSGKDGKGILPISLEPLGLPDDYGRDRFFVYLRQNGEMDRNISLLKDAGFSVIQFDIADPYEASAEFFRWEFATTVACYLLGVNPFNQPDVQESKARTKAQVAGYHLTGEITEKKLVNGSNKTPALLKFINDAKPDQFIAINAYIPRNTSAIGSLQKLRVALRAKTGCAVTAGFGPRFHHSTGQYHKGGPNKGLFIQVLYNPTHDLEIPGEGMSFGVLLRAQALGDYEALIAANRHVIRLKFDGEIVEGLNKLADEISRWNR
jgi:transaldolase/glucose-6-phosphate isomerase